MKHLEDFKLSPITDDNWKYLGRSYAQNQRCPRVFKENGVAYYVSAIIWRQDDYWYTGTVEGISSSQNITFPFIPKSFYINVKNDKIVDKTQLEEVFKYYTERK